MMNRLWSMLGYNTEDNEQNAKNVNANSEASIVEFKQPKPKKILAQDKKILIEKQRENEPELIKELRIKETDARKEKKQAVQYQAGALFRDRKGSGYDERRQPKHQSIGFGKGGHR